MQIETERTNKLKLDSLQNDIGDDSRFLESKNLDGKDLITLVIENAADYLALIISLVSLLKKNETNVTIKLEGGTKFINPTAAEITEGLKKSKNEGKRKARLGKK